MTPHATLVAARERIATPEHWTKNAFAKATDGTVVGTHDSLAASFCMLGALYVVADITSHAQRYLLAEVRRTSPFVSISGFNDSDGTTHADALATYDAAIGACPTP